MTYSIDLRRKVIKCVKRGESKVKISKMFGINKDTIYEWIKRDDLTPKKRKSYNFKIDKEALLKRVEKYPEARLVDHAKIFNVSINAIWKTFQKLGISKKNSTVQGKVVCTTYIVPPRTS